MSLLVLAIAVHEEIFVANLLWTLIVLCIALWVVGLVVHIGGGLIHLLLVIALVLFVFNVLSGRGARV
jgi:hypothetical protein